MLTHLMFDLETLGLREDAVILSLACVPFSFEEQKPISYYMDKGFYVKFSAKEQIKVYKRTMTRSTLDWWSKQNKEVRAMNIDPRDDDSSLIDGLDALTSYIKSSGYDPKKSYIWARGTYFDFPKIESMYEMIRANMPVNTWKIRDTRTYIDILTGVDDGKYILKEKHDDTMKHNCLYDAAYESASLCEIYKTCTA